MPDANQTYREITYSVVAQLAEGEVKPRVFFEDFPNRVLYVRDTPAGGGGWQDVFLADTTNPNSPVVYLANRGRMLLDRDEADRRTGARGRHPAHAKPDAPARLQRRPGSAQQVLSLDPETVFPRSGPAEGRSRDDDCRAAGAHRGH